MLATPVLVELNVTEHVAAPPGGAVRVHGFPVNEGPVEIPV
jgi:hypothetical protein